MALFLLWAAFFWLLCLFFIAFWINSYRAVKIRFFYKNKEVSFMFLKISQKLPLSIAIEDAQGNSAQVDGAPVWSLSDPALATLEVAADGMSAVLIPGDSIGSFTVQVNADADLGSGVKSILGELGIDLLSGEAAVIKLSAGEPQDKA